MTAEAAAPTPRRLLAGAAALVAASAMAGAAGLAVGFLDMGDELNARLPAHSPVLGAFALGAVVAVPFTELARRAWIGDEQTELAALVAGSSLVGWILVELAVVREVSFLQPFYAAVGLAFVVVGRHAAGRLELWHRSPRGL